ncbi:glycosyl hydrolase [Nibricoccus sp. IMCC34717]|uniref:glycosyl hydrolase n=1 Tax=Nibricoccus sp. IMCC34717 TaxID=3034021 RepID=UPI00384D7B69
MFPFGRFPRALLVFLLALAPLLRGAIDDPVSPNALPESKSLLQFMDSLRGSKILSGQYELPSWDGVFQEEEMEWLLANTGKLPAIRGFDFMRHSQAPESAIAQRNAERAYAWHRRGGIVTFCFHCAMPDGKGGRAFYTKDTPYDITKAVVEGTAENRELNAQFDAAAEELKKLRDLRVPVLWRPFHECSGGWFWWGAKGAEPFKALWRYIFDRYTQVHGLTNLIWVYNPTETTGALAAWYPGDGYVDQISYDFYPSSGHPSFASIYKAAYDFTAGRKGVWMSENGAIPDPDTMFAEGAHWTGFATWYRDFLTDGKANSLAFVKKVFAHEKVVTLDEVPALWATKPVYRIQPRGGTIRTGGTMTLSASVAASGPISYQWQRNGVPVDGANEPRLVLSGVTASHAGSYTLHATTQGGTTVSEVAEVVVDPEPYVAPLARLTSLSSRAAVGSASDVLIAGFAVEGPGSKRLLVRAVGARLGTGPFNLPGVLKDATLALYDQNSGSVIAANQDWSLLDRADNAVAFSAAGAFPLVDGSWDSALLIDVPRGQYTAVAKGNAGVTGICLIEVYDLEKTSAAYLTGISTRAKVGLGANQLIAGFSVEGAGQAKMLVRAVGPGLAPFNVTGTLSDPTMDLFRLDGSTPTKLGGNNNWGEAPNKAEILTASAAAGMFPLPDGSLDAVLLESLGGGNYTANLTGADGGTGVALMEVYLAN